MAIDKICCIIDFDGFSFRSYIDRSTFSSEFLIREIGFIRIDPEFGDFLAQSYRFDLSFYDFSHCPDATATINHQIRHITGLPLKPQVGEKVHDYSTVRACIRTIYDICRTPERDIVAFKGGDKEKMYLDELGIPNLDLSQYGCPKYKELVKRNLVQSHLIDCGFHRKIDDEAGVIHCPRAEVTAFKDWLCLNYPPG